MNNKLIRTLFITGGIVTVGFGLWHSIFPFLTHSFNYLPDIPQEITNAMLATSAFLAFSLVLLGGITLTIGFWHWEQIEIVRLSSWALTILWMMRVMYEFALPMSDGVFLSIFALIAIINLAATLWLEMERFQLARQITAQTSKVSAD